MQNKSVLSYSIFVPTLFIVGLSLVSVIFPALIVKLASPYEINLEFFELGTSAIPLLIANSILICVGFSYYKRKLPKNISKPIEFILNYEVSKLVAIIVGILLLAI
ncbi:MAG: hypothetical protein HYZ56_02740, partial [Nitrosopumilales archaeon]|nr:hypothetical protein [Nitrosopumilales archaeon]